MYCKNCGKELPEGSKFCSNCGQSTEDNNNFGNDYNNQSAHQTSSNDSGSFGWAVLGFFIPIVGLVLYLVWRDTAPNNARMAGKGALISVIISAIIFIIELIIAIILEAGSVVVTIR